MPTTTLASPAPGILTIVGLTQRDSTRNQPPRSHRRVLYKVRGDFRTEEAVAEWEYL